MINFPWNSKSSNQQKMYQNVSNSDEEMEKYASSDSEGEAFITSTPSSASQSRRRTIVSHLWSAALGCLVAVLVGLVLLAYTSLLNVNITQGSVVPDLPIETVYWKTNNDFADAPSPATNQVWDHLLPAGDGFIAVQDPAKYGLKPGARLPDGRESYGISMYHQLHCLRLLRDVYWSFAEPNNTHNALTHAAHGAHSMDHKFKMDDPHHVTHCFDYLRKAIQCAGDMAVEHVSSHVPFTKVNGNDVAHKCRSWNDAQEFMQRNAAPIRNGHSTM